MSPDTHEIGSAGWLREEAQGYALTVPPLYEAARAAQEQADTVRLGWVQRLASQGCTYRQIQAITGLPLGTLSNLLRR